MAFKITVDYVDLKLTIDTDSVESVSTFVFAKSTVTYVALDYVVDYINLTAADIITDAYSKNMYFTAEHNYFGQDEADFKVTMSDALSSLATSLAKTDAATFDAENEVVAKALSTIKADSVSMSESLSKAMQFNRSFAETPSVTEQLSYSLGKAAADSFSFSDAPTFSVSIQPTGETFSFSDSLLYSLDYTIADSFSFSDSFSRVVQFARTFSDSFTLDDAASVDDELQTDVTLNKGNVVSVSEALSYAFSTTASESVTISESFVNAFSPGTIAETASLAESSSWSFSRGTQADSVTMSEALTALFSPTYADTASLSDSISVELTIGGGPLNTTALNTSMLNA